jgi:glycosyltransferase involved in cell wall biosynthesis
MAKIKILFDAGPMLDHHRTGVGFYVNNMLNSLQQHYSDNLDLNGYYFNLWHRNPDKSPKDSDITFKEIRFMPGKLISLCRRFGFQPFLELFIRQKSDIILFTNYVSLPQLSKRKTVLIIYDVSFLDVPEYTQEVNLRYLQRFCPPSINSADAIITISEFTKERILHHFPNLTAPIIVTHIPPLELASSATLAFLPKRLADLGIHTKRYLLHVGTIEPRKNLENLLDAYSQLSPEIKTSYALVLAGGRGWKDEAIMQRIANLQTQKLDIIMTGYTSESEKNALYANAACLVMASHYEGFGMPILEAMQHAIPTAISDIAVFHEVANDSSIYFNKDDPHDIAEKLTILLTDQSKASVLTESARQHLKSFSWQVNAEQILLTFENLNINRSDIK